MSKKNRKPDLKSLSPDGYQNGESNLARKAGSAALWQIAGGGWQTVIRLGASTILARKLDPADFGLFGMALLVSELIMVFTNLGMGSGIIAKKDITEKDLNTCFWTMAGVRMIMFITVEACAPLVALFFKDPRVTSVVRVVGFNFLFTIPSVVTNTLLIKGLRFKVLVLVRGGAVLLESLLAVLLVLTTKLHYWALVIPMLIASFFAETTIFLAVNWRAKFAFDKDSFKYLFRYGINELGFSITNYFQQNVDYLVVGRLLGAKNMGLYEFAYKIPHLVLERISRPIGGVVFPALSKVQDDDQKIIEIFIKSVKYTTFLVYPALGGLAVLAGQIVPVLWGDKWIAVVHPLQILCLRAAVHCSIQPVGSIFLCKDRPDIPFRFSVVSSCFTMTIVAIGGYNFGLIGIAWGMVVSTLPYSFILNLAFKMTHSSIFRFAKALFPAMFSTIICMLCSYGTLISLRSVFQDQLVTLVFAIMVGIFSYTFTLLTLFRGIRKEIFEILYILFLSNLGRSRV